jgi:hypothetical protein
VGLKQVQFSQLGTCPAQIEIIQSKSMLLQQEYNVVGNSSFTLLNQLIFIFLG